MLFPLRPNQYGRNNYPGRLYSVPQRPYILFLRPVLPSMFFRVPKFCYSTAQRFFLFTRQICAAAPPAAAPAPKYSLPPPNYSVLSRQIFCSSAPNILFFRANFSVLPRQIIGSSTKLLCRRRAGRRRQQDTEASVKISLGTITLSMRLFPVARFRTSSCTLALASTSGRQQMRPRPARTTAAAPSRVIRG